MAIRHITPLDNVDRDGHLVDGQLAWHAAIVNGAVASMSGEIDPLTHLNVDFPDHQLGECVVVERAEIGAAVLRDDDGNVRRATLRSGDERRLGRVDVGLRRMEWQRALAERRAEVG